MMLPIEVLVARMVVLPAVLLDVRPVAPLVVLLDALLVVLSVAGFADAFFFFFCGIHDPIQGMDAVSFIAPVKLACPSTI